MNFDAATIGFSIMTETANGNTDAASAIINGLDLEDLRTVTAEIVRAYNNRVRRSVAVQALLDTSVEYAAAVFGPDSETTTALEIVATSAESIMHGG